MSETALSRGLELLRGADRFDATTLDAFAAFLKEARDEDLFRMNPISYAAARGLPENVAIDLFLYATHFGLLEFTWGVLCPMCRAFLTTPGALRAMATTRRCSLCDCDAKFHDDALEVAFTVSPAVRRTRFHDLASLDFQQDGLRVIFSPSIRIPAEAADALRKSAIASGRVNAGEVAVVAFDVSKGMYRVAAPYQHAWLKIFVDPAAPAVPVIEADLADGRIVPGTVTVAPGRVELRLRNLTGQASMFGVSRAVEGPRLSDIAPMERYFSGKRLVTTQAFRDLFRSESIPAGAGLEFKSITVLFTDLKGSTELYERIGDLRAYALVREHFDLLRSIIRESGGSMVKTIGDAIMASFAEVESAMKAAAAMRERISRVGEGELQLKIGLHTGPCIAVELNEQLDYFGQTVNVASRVQNLASGGEIVCTEQVWHGPNVRAVVERAGLRSTRDKAVLKGVEGEVQVVRLQAA